MRRQSRAIVRVSTCVTVLVTALSGCGPSPAAGDSGGVRDEASSDAADESAESTVARDFAWEPLADPPSVGARFGALVAAAGDGIAYVHGGVTAALTSGSAHDTFRIELRDGAPVVTTLPTTNDPPGRSRGCMAFDPTGQRLVMTGGRADGTSLSDSTTWQLSLATRAWSPVATREQPPGQVGCAMVWSPRENAAYHFGGAFLAGSGGEWSNALFRFDGATNQWARVEATGAPSARYDATLALSGDGSELLLFGGGIGVRSQGRFTADLYRFEIATRAWTRLPATGAAPTARRGHFMLPSRDAQRILVGLGESATEGLTDLWLYDRSMQRWTKLDPTGENLVEPVHAFSMVLDGGGAGLVAVVLGGYDETGFPVDAAWRLRAPPSRWP